MRVPTHSICGLSEGFGSGWASLRRLALWGNQFTGELTEQIQQSLLVRALQEEMGLYLAYNALDVENPLLKILFQNILNRRYSWDDKLIQTQALPPQALEASEVLQDGVTLSWQPQVLDPLPEPAQEGDPPVGGDYVITVEGLEPIVLEDVNQTSYQFTNLTPNTTYKIQIQAFTNAHSWNPNKITSMPSPILEVTTAKP